MPAIRLRPLLALWIGLAVLTSATRGAQAADAPTTATPTPAAQAPAAAPPALGFGADDVRHHLGHVIDWYHRLGGLAANPALTDDVLTRERLHQLRLVEVRLAFGFGRAAAALVNEQPEGVPDPASQEDETFRYEKMAARTDERTRELAAQLARLDAQLGQASGPERATLAAQRAQTNAALTLTNEVKATVLRLQQFAARSNSSASGEKGLLADITDMERTVPEARLNPASARPANATAAATTASAAAATAAPVDAEATVRKDTGGLIALSNEWFALRAAMRVHVHYMDATDELSKALDKLSSGLAAQVRELLLTTATAVGGGDARQFTESRAAIEGATVRFRELSTLLIPLGEESITLDSTREVLDQRRASLEQRALAVARQVALRGALLIACVFVILGISALWRRATFRYLHDSRRRRQFLTLRRVATGLALIIVAFVAFLSEIGSLATYIGFLTAGIAVALQNVILAVVAYFFLIGRYGVRVGDRVTMAGVTGRVAEIGLVRIYLTELAGQDLNPTGRMIVLSNAVVFQPTALFKQLPGVNYTWHTTTFTLAQTADVQLARARLQARADKVFASYRDSIEKQVHAARHLTDFDSVTPQPEVTARFSPHGLEITVRYPVEPEQAALIDQHMARALREELDAEPALALASAAEAAPAG